MNGRLRPDGLCLSLAVAALCLSWTDAAGGDIHAVRQMPSGTRLTVVVVDQTGAVVPGAMVSVARPDVPSRQPLAIVSNAAGAAVFEGLLPGEYSVTVQIDGFVQDRPAVVRLGEAERRISVRLSLAKLAAEITVGAGRNRRRRGARPSAAR